MSVIENKELHRQRYPNWLDLVAVVGIFLGASLVAGLIMTVVQMVVQPEQGMVNAATYALTFVIAILSIILMQRHRGAKKNFVKFNFMKFNPVMILLGIVLVFVSGVVIEPLLAIFSTDLYNKVVTKGIGTGGWAIFMTVVLAPIFEEVLFRGLVLEPVREKGGATRAVLISALLFGVIHFVPQQVVNAFVIGIILGFVYVKTGSLVNVILIHAVNNGVAYLQMELLGDSAVTTTTRDMIGNDTWYWTVYVLCVILFGLSLYAMMRSLKKTKAAEAEKSTESPLQNNNTD